MTNLEILQHVSPNGSPSIIKGVADSLDKHAADFGLTTTARLTNFLAQASEETNGFRTLTEYASGKTYEGRTDIGNTSPGDGVKYKGRGIFQTTGKLNYLSASHQIFGDERLLTNPELLATPEYATLAALHYWQDHNLNAAADMPDDHVFTITHKDGSKTNYNKIQYITLKINGGENGLATRQTFFDRALSFLKTGNGTATIVIFLIVAILIFQTIKK